MVQPAGQGHPSARPGAQCCRLHMPACHSMPCCTATQCQPHPGSPTCQSNVPIAATSLRYVRSWRLHSPTSPSLAAPEAVSSTLELCSAGVVRGRSRAISRGSARQRHSAWPNTPRRCAQAAVAAWWGSSGQLPKARQPRGATDCVLSPSLPHLYVHMNHSLQACQGRRGRVSGQPVCQAELLLA